MLEGVELVPGVGSPCSMKVFRGAKCRCLRGKRAWERWGFGVGHCKGGGPGGVTGILTLDDSGY